MCFTNPEIRRWGRVGLAALGLAETMLTAGCTKSAQIDATTMTIVRIGEGTIAVTVRSVTDDEITALTVGVTGPFMVRSAYAEYGQQPNGGQGSQYLAVRSGIGINGKGVLDMAIREINR